MNKYLISTLLGSALTLPTLAHSASPLVINGITKNPTTGVSLIPNPNPVVSTTVYNNEVSVDTTKSLTATGNLSSYVNVTINGVQQAVALSLLSPPAGNYGFLNFSSNGLFTYTLYDKSLAVLQLSASQSLDEYFQYSVQGYPNTTAYIHVHIAGNPNAVLPQNDEVSIDTQTKSISGNVATNDDVNNAAANSVSWNLTSPASTPYGFLKFDSTGAFTYNLNVEASIVTAIPAGETITDLFQYAVVGKDGRSVPAQLTVRITGNPIVVKALDDEATVDTAANPTVTGNVLDNDLNTQKGTAAISGLASSNYGQLAFDSSGKFTYSLFTEAPAVIALQPGQVVSDVFEYSVKGTNGIGSASAKLTIRIAGGSSAATSVKAGNDSATLVIDAASNNSTLDLNVLSNDINVGSVSLSGSPVGQYGFIVGGIGQDGKLTYRVDLNNPAVQNALKTGSSLTDTFLYTATGKAPNQNQSSQGKISIYIVAGTIGSFKAFDYIDSIIAESGAAAINGDLVAYNNNLLNSTDTSTRSQLLSSQIGRYGFLQYSSSTNKFTYTLNYNVPEIQALRTNSTPLQEVFKYRLINRFGSTADAQIVINIVSHREQTSADNVEIENNDNSNLATPLNSGNYMRGTLRNGDDRDWFYITTSGDEIINVELCPQGFACNAQGAWVLYVLDGDKLTQEMQNASVPLRLTRDDTGAVLSSFNETHMYLLYQYDKFKEALVGVIDPCYPPKNADGTGGGRTTIEVGVKTVPPGTTKNFFFAISSPLQRDGGGSNASTTCSSGSITLKKPGPTFKDLDPADRTKTIDVKTTQEYIGIYPNSDDQYTFKVTRTGVSPLSTTTTNDTAVYSSSTGNAQVPKVRVGEDLYAVELQPGIKSKSASTTPSFHVSNVARLPQAVVPNPYIGTYNPATSIVRLPKVTIDKTNEAYSVDLRYYSNSNLELISATPLQK